MELQTNGDQVKFYNKTIFMSRVRKGGTLAHELKAVFGKKKIGIISHFVDTTAGVITMLSN